MLGDPPYPTKPNTVCDEQRVLTAGAVFAICDVLQYEGGAVLHPIRWARTPDISRLAPLAKMMELFAGAAFRR